MRLLNLTLENVKSYCKASISFSGGVNAICGKNGAGKSTILEAIGFVLFDFLPVSQKEFVRDGHKTATVSLDIEHDGKKYTIERSCGASSSYIVTSNGKDIASGKADVLAFLSSLHGTDDVQSVFRDAVGVPQGTLTSAFLETPANRKRIFSSIIKVDEYERAWSALRDAERMGENRLHELEKQAASLEAKTTTLDDVHQKINTIQNSIEANERNLDTLKQNASTKSDLLTEMNTKRDEIESVRHELDSATNEIKLLEAELEHAKQDLEAAERAHEIATSCASAHIEYNELKLQLQELDAMRPRREELLLMISKTQSQITDHERRLEELHKQLDDSMSAQDRLAELTPLVTKLDELEEEVKQLRARLTNHDMLVSSLKDARRELNEAQQGLESAKSNMALVTKLAEEISIIEDNLSQEMERRDLVKDEGASTKSRIAELKNRIAELSGNISVCPVCGTKLTDEHRNRLITESTHEIENLSMLLEQKRAEWKQHNESVKRMEQELSAKRRALATAEARSNVDEYTHLVNKQQEKVRALEEMVTANETVRRSIESAEAEIANLKHARTEWIKLSTVPSPEEINTSIETLSCDLDGLLNALSEYNAEFGAQYSDLENLIAQVNERMCALEEKNQLYMENEKLAAHLEELRGKYDDLSHDLESKRHLAQVLTDRIDVLLSGYDQDAHQQLASDVSSLTVEIARVENTIGVLRDQLNGLLEEERALASYADKLRTVRESIDHYNKAMHLLSFLRQCIRDAGPEIASLVVGSISMRADQLFSSIIQSPGAHLVWDEGYGITVSDGGSERHFNQLSGGEQMAAALAVRLALLKEISNIDIAFFDEPTVNLDAHRRESLAEQIMNIKGFSQIFVISHDDTFEQGIDNVIRIEKVDGESVPFPG